MKKFVSVISILILLLTAGGCTRTVLVPTESASVRTDTVRVLRTDSDIIRTIYADTVRILDSVLIDRSKDTVIIDRTRTVEKVRNRTDTVSIVHTDTVYRASSDSLRQTKPPEKVAAAIKSGSSGTGWRAGVVVVALVVIIISTVWIIKITGKK